MAFRRTVYSLAEIASKTSLSDALATTKVVGGSGKNRLVILGTGWGGFNLALGLKNTLPADQQLRIVSPSNHFVFTPLLPSTAVGTLEFRCIQEPIRKALGENGNYVQAKASAVDPKTKTILCESTFDDDKFAIKYDKLVIAVGVKTNTFGIDSIQEGDGIYFLKHLYHARNIRNNIVDSFEKAAIPGTSEEERRRLLSFVVVGGGPTSCEFVAELHDFVTNDVKKMFGHLLPYVKVTLVEAGPALLAPFEANLQSYTRKLFKKRDIDVRLGCSVTGVEEYFGDGFRFKAKKALLSDGSELPFGTLVWSAGLAPVKFTEAIDGVLPRAPNGRIITDEYLRVKGHEGSIWAIGDAAVCDTEPHAQLAQVARQQGLYLADVLSGKQKDDEKPFKFFNLGSMASLGEMKGIYDGSNVGVKGMEVSVPKIKGLVALLMWRFAYWGRQTSIENKFLIPMHWLKSFLFGRDVSRF